MKKVAILTALLLLAGCSSTKPVTPTVDGLWKGSFGPQSIQMTLSENVGAVTGAGTLGTTPVTVQGSHADPSISLTFSIQGVGAVNGSGQTDGSQMVLTLSGAGYTGTSSSLTKY